MKAEPNCKRQEMSPVLPTMRLAQVPRKMPVLLDQLRWYKRRDGEGRVLEESVREQNKRYGKEKLKGVW